MRWVRSSYRMREGVEEVFEDGMHRDAVDVFPAAWLYNPPATQLLQRLHRLFPARPDQTLLRRFDVVFQQLEKRVKTFLTAGQTELGVLEVNPDAHGTVRRFVTERVEDVNLPTVPDEKRSHWLFLQLMMRLLHGHGTPVEAALLQHGRGVRDGLEVSLDVERSEVCLKYGPGVGQLPGSGGPGLGDLWGSVCTRPGFFCALIPFHRTVRHHPTGKTSQCGLPCRTTWKSSRWDSFVWRRK